MNFEMITKLKTNHEAFNDGSYGIEELETDWLKKLGEVLGRSFKMVGIEKTKILGR